MQDTTLSKFSYDSFRNSFLNLSVHEQAGFFLWPSISSYELSSEEKELFSEIKPSGVVLFKRNFSDIIQSKMLISEIRALCLKKNTPFEKNFIVSADEEGGRVSRLPLGAKTKPVLEFVRNHDKEGLKNQVLLQTRIAHEIGMNCMLAPVLDIFTEPQNNVIGDRSFGHTAEEVCEYADIVFNILENEHIFCCAKHFPGHGNTIADSHVDFAISNATKDVLEKREWIPFVHFIQKNIPLIMAAHVILPNLEMDPKVNRREQCDKVFNDTNSIPATLNYHVLTKILREELGFKGLILSDDLHMGAIKKIL